VARYGLAGYADEGVLGGGPMLAAVRIPPGVGGTGYPGVAGLGVPGCEGIAWLLLRYGDGIALYVPVTGVVAGNPPYGELGVQLPLLNDLFTAPGLALRSEPPHLALSPTLTAVDSAATIPAFWSAPDTTSTARVPMRSA
jgi:hypothetical protein